jgi:hypothetical protein
MRPAFLTHQEEVKGEQTMTIQEAVNKATEGGYHMHGSDGIETSYIGANDEYSAWTRTDNDSSFRCPWRKRFSIPGFGKR